MSHFTTNASSRTPTQHIV